MEAHLYEELARQEDSHWWFHGRRAVVRSVLEKYLPSTSEPRRILDVGCGTGGMLSLLRDYGTVEGLESTEDAIRLCAQRLGPEVVIHRGIIPDDLPRSAPYDVVTAFDVLEHLDDPVGSLRAIREILKPGGLVICAVPAFQFLWSEHDEVHHHRKRYTLPGLRAELNGAGFEVAFTSYFNTLLFPPIAAARVLGKLRRAKKADAPRSDLQQVPRILNSALGMLFAAERLLVPRVALPVGVSLVVVGRAGAAH